MGNVSLVKVGENAADQKSMLKLHGYSKSTIDHAIDSQGGMAHNTSGVVESPHHSATVEAPNRFAKTPLYGQHQHIQIGGMQGKVKC